MFVAVCTQLEPNPTWQMYAQHENRHLERCSQVMAFTATISVPAVPQLCYNTNNSVNLQDDRDILPGST